MFELNLDPVDVKGYVCMSRLTTMASQYVHVASNALGGVPTAIQAID